MPLTMRTIDADTPEVRYLAAVDSQEVPEGEVILAERDGRPLAAAPLNGGLILADPFKPTAKVVKALEALRGRG